MAFRSTQKKDPITYVLIAALALFVAYQNGCFKDLVPSVGGQASLVVAVRPNEARPNLQIESALDELRDKYKEISFEISDEDPKNAVGETPTHLINVIAEYKKLGASEALIIEDKDGKTVKVIELPKTKEEIISVVEGVLK